jgi:hypothetical protein
MTPALNSRAIHSSDVWVLLTSQNRKTKKTGRPAADEERQQQKEKPSQEDEEKGGNNCHTPALYRV